MQKPGSSARVKALRDLLHASLTPEHLWIFDESAPHVGHAGARSGAGHYYVRVVTSRFEGQSRLERHRRIYQAVGELFGKEIHALRIDAFAPGEWRAAPGTTCDCCVCDGEQDATPLR